MKGQPIEGNVGPHYPYKEGIKNCLGEEMPEISPMPSFPTEIIAQVTKTPSAKLLEKLAEAKSEEAPKAPPSVVTETLQKATPGAPPVAPDAKDDVNITADTSPQDSMRIAALVRKEKQLLKRARDLEALEKKLNENQSRYKPWEEASELATKNKLEAIKKLGITYEDLTTQMLNGGNLPPEAIARQYAEEEVRRQITEFKQQFEEQQKQHTQQNYQNAIKQIDADVQARVEADDKFSLVKESGSYHDVTEYIEKAFHETGRMVPVEMALEKVEAKLEEDLLKFLKVDKIRSKLLPREEPKVDAAPVVSQVNPKLTTLTHKTVNSPPATKPMTYAEKRARAIAIMEGRAV